MWIQNYFPQLQAAVFYGVCGDIMVYKVSYTHESHSLNRSDSEKYQYIDIYSRDVSDDHSKMTFGSFLKRCLCCTSTTEDEADFIVDSQTSGVVRPSVKSYTVNSKTPSKSATEQTQDLPTLIVTRPLDDEFCTSRTTLLLASERSASASDDASTTSYCLKNAKSTTYKACIQGNTSQESVNSQGVVSQESINSQSDGPLGETVSFIREIVSCRDSFLKSLEWCDNSLTRGKRYRFVKPDEWLELKDDGSEFCLDFLRHTACPVLFT